MGLNNRKEFFQKNLEENLLNKEYEIIDKPVPNEIINSIANMFIIHVFDLFDNENEEGFNIRPTIVDGNKIFIKIEKLNQKSMTEILIICDFIDKNKFVIENILSTIKK